MIVNRPGEILYEYVLQTSIIVLDMQGKPTIWHSRALAFLGSIAAF